jgi:hypothetical protein
LQRQLIQDSSQAGSRLIASDAYPVELRLLLLLCRQPVRPSDLQQANALCEAMSDWEYFLQLAAHHRVISVIARHAGGASLPEKIAAQLNSYASTNAIESFRSLKATRRLFEILSTVGIRATVLKGVPLSLQAFGDVATRDVGDIDLLIKPEEAEAADGVLLESGFVRKEPAGKLTPRRRASYVGHFKDYTYEAPGMQSEGGFEVDLHWRLFRNPHMPGNRLTADGRADISTGPLQLQTLSPETHLLYLAVLGAVDGWTRFKAVVDFAALWNAVPDSEALLDRAQRADVVPYLRAALLLAQRWIGGGRTMNTPGDILKTPDGLAESICESAERRMQASHFLPQLRETSSWEMKRYEASLHTSGAYRSAILSRVLFRPRVWDRFDLLDSFFPLYPFLSPLEWLLFHLRSGKDRP